MKNSLARISEIFSSVQGEGIYAGQSQVFVRFAGCNLECAYCDTDTSLFKEVSKRECMSRIFSLDGRLNLNRTISFTGGEPLLQIDFLKDIFPECKKRSYRIYLETNGTLFENLLKVIQFVDVVAMDIKLPTATKREGLWQAHKKFLYIACSKEVFVKIVITDETGLADFKEAIALVRDIGMDIPFVIQPVTKIKDICPPAAKKILEFLKLAHNELSDVRVIPQIHKFIGVR